MTYIVDLIQRYQTVPLYRGPNQVEAIEMAEIARKTRSGVISFRRINPLGHKPLN